MARNSGRYASTSPQPKHRDLDYLTELQISNYMTPTVFYLYEVKQKKKTQERKLWLEHNIAATLYKIY